MSDFLQVNDERVPIPRGLRGKALDDWVQEQINQVEPEEDTSEDVEVDD